MCTPASAALIGGGAILQSMGQRRALAAQEAVANATQLAIASAQDAANDRALDMASQITERGIRQADTGDIERHLENAGVNAGGARRSTQQMAGAQVPAAVNQMGRDMQMDLAQLGSDIAGIRRGLQLDLLPQESAMRLAGMKGGDLRGIGQLMQVGGQAAASFSANQKPLSPQAKAIAQDAPSREANQQLDLRLQGAYDPRSDLDLYTMRQRQGMGG